MSKFYKNNKQTCRDLLTNEIITLTQAQQMGETSPLWKEVAEEYNV